MSILLSYQILKEGIILIVIYAEKASLAKAIAVALKAGNRIAHPKEPTIGHYEFTFNGEKTVLCHGVGHLYGLADRTAYGEQYKNWDLSAYLCAFSDRNQKEMLCSYFLQRRQIDNLGVV